ncbi:hypothetical protein RB597_004997 [Gaeumannomyces tritici]
MGLRDLLKKKDKDGDEGGGPAEKQQQQQHQGAAGGDDDHLARPPDFKFIRSDTHSAEVIHPPSAPVTPKVTAPGGDSGSISGGEGGGSGRRSFFGGSSSSSSRKRDQSTTTTTTGHLGSGEKKEKGLRRLSQKLHLTRSSGGTSSENVPQDLPEIVVAPAVGSGDGDGDGDGNEAQWEQRATLLARENERVRSRPGSPDGGGGGGGGGDLAGGLGSMEIGDGGAGGGSGGRKRSASAVSTKAIDDDIQEAIRLHEAGDLERSTVLFGRLADPQGANNPLSQVLYGLALRHGWGCEPDQAGAVHYLSKAAANAATVETLALQAGMKKGGAAKGELVLAIFELANCFRHGWGVPKDAVAAKQYYETAANLGDTDVSPSHTLPRRHERGGMVLPGGVWLQEGQVRVRKVLPPRREKRTQDAGELVDLEGQVRPRQGREEVTRVYVQYHGYTHKHTHARGRSHTGRALLWVCNYRGFVVRPMGDANPTVPSSLEGRRGTWGLLLISPPLPSPPRIPGPPQSPTNSISCLAAVHSGLH